MGLFSFRKPAPVEDLRGIVNAIDRSQAVTEFQMDGTILVANANFLQTLGYSLDEVRGRHHSLFVDPAESGASAYREFWATLNRGEYVARKFRRLGKGGREIWIQASYNPVFDDVGKPIKVIKFATDITGIELDRVRNEAEREIADREQTAVVAGLADALSSLARSDLTSRIEVPFEGRYAPIKEDFNNAIDSLCKTMRAIAQATQGLDSGATEISGASDDLSRRTEQQAASLEETAAALDQITATVKQSADNARLAAGAVSGTRDQAAKSGEVMRDAVIAMGEIEQSSAQITQIISVID